MDVSLTVRVGFVGAGTVAGYHRSALARTPGIELVALADANAATAAARAVEWGVAVADDLDDLLADDEIDAVYVLTPHRFHTPLALKVIDAGKHVLIEKPVATSGQEMAALTAAADAAGTVVMPGHNYAHVPEFQRMVRMVRNGELGAVRALFITYAMRHRDGYAAKVGGAMQDLFVHPAYLAVALLGRPSRVTAGTAGDVPLGDEDQAWITVESGRATGHLLCTFAVDDHSSDPWTFAARLLGSEGSSSMTWRDATIGHTDNLNHVGGYALPMFEESFEHEAAAFRDAITAGTAPVSTVADAVSAWQLLAAARESIDTGATVDLGGRA